MPGGGEGGSALRLLLNKTVLGPTSCRALVWCGGGQGGAGGLFVYHVAVDAHKSVSLRRLSYCRVPQGPVTHLDFDTTGVYLQVMGWAWQCDGVGVGGAGHVGRRMRCVWV